MLSSGSPFDCGIYTGLGCGQKSRKLNQQWLTPNDLLKGLVCLEGLPLSAGGAPRRRALHTAYRLNQALARNISIFEPHMRLGTRLFGTRIVCLFTISLELVLYLKRDAV
jgi:hypothetical protein